MWSCRVDYLIERPTHMVAAFNTVSLMTMKPSDWLITKLLLLPTTKVNNAGCCYVQFWCQIISPRYAKLIPDLAKQWHWEIWKGMRNILTLEGMKGGRVWVEVKSRSDKRRPRTSSKIMNVQKDRQTNVQTLLSEKRGGEASVKTPVADLGLPIQWAPNEKGRVSAEV